MPVEVWIALLNTSITAILAYFLSARLEQNKKDIGEKLNAYTAHLEKQNIEFQVHYSRLTQRRFRIVEELLSSVTALIAFDREIKSKKGSDSFTIEDPRYRHIHKKLRHQWETARLYLNENTLDHVRKLYELYHYIYTQRDKLTKLESTHSDSSVEQLQEGKAAKITALKSNIEKSRMKASQVYKTCLEELRQEIEMSKQSLPASLPS
jgi:hypothetical protein